MAILPSHKADEPRQPLFGHGSLINPSAEHTILDPFQPPMSTASQIYQNLSSSVLATEVAVTVNALEPVIIQPDSYNPEFNQTPSID